MLEPHDTFQQLWLKHAKAIGIEKQSMPLLSQLMTAWSEAHRRYHTLRHLRECLQLLERWGKDEPARHEIGIALWFHDAVYDPQRDDNEEKSARWAAKALKALEAGGEVVLRIGRLIRVTKHLAPSTPRRAVRVDGLDLMLDIDLAILGADRARFEEYERQVRHEYAHVDDARFAQGRARFVEAMLGVSPLYRTEAARAELETRARENLLRSLQTWRQGADEAAPPLPLA